MYTIINEVKSAYVPVALTDACAFETAQTDLDIPSEVPE